MRKEPKYPRDKDFRKTTPPRMEGMVKNAKMFSAKKKPGNFRYLRG
jgi:hypothetical protein